jgi:4-amino-4-deoxy-L-arabinose transferase-like glycosyltransferase
MRYNGAVPRRTEWLLIVAILLTAAWLRVYRLDGVPPGWRDDEVVETTVHAALVQQGHWLLFFPQAEGHEPLYHYLSAAWISLAGQSLFSVRLVSACLGLLSVAALYRLARYLFGGPAALVAAAALAISFWALMYSRFKLRQVGEVAPMLLAFYFFFRVLAGRADRMAARPRFALLAALCLSAALYTYFAARAVPLILLAVAIYLFMFHRALFRARWRLLALIAGVTVGLVAPLAVAIARTPQGEARLGQVGAPLADLLRGDPTNVLRNAAETLAMPAFTGDPEYLYNIPGRPVFETLGVALFVVGVGLSLWHWRQPRSAFLIVWLVGGLAPAFVSTPSASLGHTIAAQPVVYLFPAVAVAAMGQRMMATARKARPRLQRAATLTGPALAAVFLIITAGRDLRDYFIRWPALPQVRFLYRADLHDAAPALRRLPPHSDLGLASATLQPADALALMLETPGLGLQPRVFAPARAWPFPAETVPVLLRESAWPIDFGQAPLAGDYALRPASLAERGQPAVPLMASFQNGWVCIGYTLAGSHSAAGALSLRLDTYWLVGPSFVAPPPRPVDVLSGLPLPLKFFSHLLNPDGHDLAGDDRLDIDPATLRAGDTFVQVFVLEPPAGSAPGDYAVQIGLYDPASGVRVRLANGDANGGLILTTLHLPE